MSSDDESHPGRIRDDPAAIRDGYIELILRTMRLKRVSLRMLARKTNIGKSRLGLLLHRDPAHRCEIGLAETRSIFDALDIDTFAAVICVEGFRDISVLDRPPYTSVIALLRVIYRWLPIELVTAMEEYEHIDDGDVRPEWAVGLQRAFVKRVVKEVSRRAAERLAGWDFDL